MSYTSYERRTWHVDYSRVTEKAAASAERAVPKAVRRRRLVVGRQVYVAYDGHSLLEATSEHGERPGHPVG